MPNHSNKFTRLIKNIANLNQEMIVDLIAGEGVKADDFKMAFEAWQLAIQRTKKLSLRDACMDDGMDLLMLHDCGFEEADRKPAVELFKLLTAQKSFIEKFSAKPKTKKPATFKWTRVSGVKTKMSLK